MENTSDDKMTPSILSSLLAGGISSAIAKTAVAPLEYAKINFQVSDTTFTLKNVLAFLSKTTRAGGPTALWRGHTATLARIVPSSAIAFAANDIFKHLLNVDGKPDEESKHARGFLAGAMAGTVAHTATYPLDVARTTMAVSSTNVYRNISQAIRGTYRREGFRGLYSGYTVSLIGVIPNSAIRFGLYGLLKEVHAERKGTELNPLEQGACGAASGATAMLMTYPLEVVRRHQQMATLTEEKKKNFVETFKTIRTKEGIRKGLYKGLSINCVIMPLQAGLAFAGFEVVKKLLQKVLP